ncbi:MAG: DEAD/DEAH box helicase [bacterium]|nr:DEAD/DEAH box helicase [bacterium]
MKRIKTLVDESESKPLEIEIRALQRGFIPERFDQDQEIAKILTEANISNEPLSFVELTRYSTYFAMHPDHVAGTEKITTSQAFPVTVKGSETTVKETIEAQLNKSNDMELEALALELELELLNSKLKTGSKPKNGINGLPTLGELVRSEIDNNSEIVRTVLEKSKRQQQAKDSDKLTFKTIVEEYNKGISFDEIVAWVWYKQSLGVPMNGWNEYFITSNQGEATASIITTKETMIRDNHFRELHTVPAGKVLGRPTKKTLEYSGSVYRIFRDAEGLKYVNEKDSRVEKTSLKVDPEELDRLVKAGALFYLNGELLPLPIYSYGNMYDRELELRKDQEVITKKYGTEVYERHLQIIKENRPTPLTVTNPDATERPKILAISDFATEFQVSALRDEYGIINDEPTSLVLMFAEYLGKLDESEFEESSAFYVKQHYLYANRVTDNYLTKEQKAERKTNARNQGEILFEKFLHEALLFEDQQKLDLLWNRTFNGQSSLAYHKVPVGFEASAKFKQFNLEIRPAQREGIAFMEALGSGVIAYDVGVGKTLTAIVTLANAIQNGKAKRPMIVVPNPTYKKWIEEIIGYKSDSGTFVPGVLSNTGITINAWYNLNNDIASKINLSKPVPEKSITIVTYEGFKKIGFSQKVMESMFYELANILAQSKVGASQRDIEIEYDKYREKIGLGLKGTILDIDALGLDYIVIDEAHRCKNIFDTVKADKKGNKRFGLQGRTSETGIKAFFICNYLQRTFGRNVCLLTATPFTNSPLEIYSMLSLVARYGMQKMGLSNIKSFFEQFVQESTELVVNQREEIVPKDVIKRFNNRLVLQKLIYNHINYKTGEEAGVKRPCKINLPRTTKVENGRIVKLKPSEQTLTYLAMTPLQRENQNAITAFAKDAAKDKSNTADIFRAMNMSLNNALSPFLYEGSPEDYFEYVEQSPKIKYTIDCIASVKAYHEKRNESTSGQIIYMNRGKDFFPLIKEYLEKEVGYETGRKWKRMKVDEVEIISSNISATRKEGIKDAFLAGVVKVIIGTATIREGIDLQNKGTVIYNCYPDWNPTDIRQLEGRIWRQGNEFGFVRVAMPLVQDSMDVFVFQKLEEKTARINDIWFKGDRGNVLDLESLDPEEVKFALITDVEAIANLKKKRLIKEQQLKIDKQEYQISVLKDFQQMVSDYKEYRELCLKIIKSNTSGIRGHWMMSVDRDSDKFKEYSKEVQSNINAIHSLYNDLIAFAENSEQENRTILQLTKRISNFKESYFKREIVATYEYFKLYTSQLVKAEKSIFKSRGYTMESDFKTVFNEFQKELEVAQKELSRLKSAEFMQELLREVKTKKSALQVDAKTIKERVEEFAALNYLLSFKFHHTKHETCFIPSPKMEMPPESNNLELELLALELELELLDFAA